MTPEPSEREQQARALDKMRQELPFYGPEEAALLAGASALRSSAGLAASQELVDAVRIFLKQWAIMKPVLDGHAVLAHVHGMPYTGPTIGNEIERLIQAHAALLASAQDGEK